MMLDKNKEFIFKFNEITFYLRKRFKSKLLFLNDLTSKGLDNLSVQIIDCTLDNYNPAKTCNILLLNAKQYIENLVKIIHFYNNNLDLIKIIYT